MPIKDCKEVCRLETKQTCLANLCHALRRLAGECTKCFAGNDTPIVRCSYFMVSLFSHTFNTLLERSTVWCHFQRKQNGAINIMSTSQQCRRVINVQPCSVQGLNNISMVSLFMNITRKHMALVMCASMFYVRKCWTNFD